MLVCKMMSRRLRLGCMGLALFLVACALLWALDCKMYPLRHLPRHRHCLKQTGLALRMYAGDHTGRLPTHPNGYGDALLLALPHVAGCYTLLTGPGYSPDAFEVAGRDGTDVPETECGRVFIQGLTVSNSPSVIVMFDKMPTPGTDHCFGLRHFKPLAREVLFLDGHVEAVLESEWMNVVTQQISLLVAGGMDRATADAYYSEKPRVLTQGWRALRDWQIVGLEGRSTE